MRNRRIMGTAVLLLFVFVAVNPDVVSAQSAALSLDFPLTPQEQVARLRGLAGLEVARKLYPSAAETLKSSRGMSYYQRNYSREFKELPDPDSYEGRRLSERIGEQGRARFAAEQGWIKLQGSGNRGVRQGPDAVYYDPRSGRLIALEAKGGKAQPAWSLTFDSRQGTNQYHLRSAKNVLTGYRNAATPEMKVVMFRVLLAAEKGQLDSGVVRTTHVLGKPNVPEFGGWDHTNVKRGEARRLRREIIKTNPEARAVSREARWGHRQDRLKYRAAQAAQSLAVVGLAGALGLGWDAYQQSRAAWSMFDDPTLKGSMLPYMQTGMVVGRTTQAAALGVISTAQLGIWKLPATVAGAQRATAQAAQAGIRKLSARGVVQVAGRAFLPVTLGVEGLQLATAFHEYGLGRISQREFYQRSVGPAIMAAFTAGGATVGGVVGFQAVGVGVVPGAMTGAKIGAFAAIPIQLAADYMVNWYYREFDEQQRQVVNTAVEAFYGLEARSGVVQR